MCTICTMCTISCVQCFLRLIYIKKTFSFVLLILNACSLIFFWCYRCPKQYLNLFISIHNTKYDHKTLISLKISKYSHKVLLLVFKIFNHCLKALWALARYAEDPYKLFIALVTFFYIYYQFECYETYHF